jgi:putative ABC transport system permease protein
VGQLQRQLLRHRPPALLRDEPATYVTSFHLPKDREALIPELLRAFPSVTLIDVGTLLGQVRGIIEQGIRAVEYVFAFTLAAGLLVMYAGIQASLRCAAASTACCAHWAPSAACCCAA